MENQIPRESLLFIVIALVGYGVKVIETQVIIGIVCLVLGAGLLVLRAYLKKLGWDIAGRK